MFLISLNLIYSYYNKHYLKCNIRVSPLNARLFAQVHRELLQH